MNMSSNNDVRHSDQNEQDEEDERIELPSAKKKKTKSGLGKDVNMLVGIFDQLTPTSLRHGDGFALKEKHITDIKGMLEQKLTDAKKPESILEKFNPALIRRKFQEYVKSKLNAKGKWAVEGQKKQQKEKNTKTKEKEKTTEKKKKTTEKKKKKQKNNKPPTAKQAAKGQTLASANSEKTAEQKEKEREHSTALLTEVLRLKNVASSIDGLLTDGCARKEGDTTVAKDLFKDVTELATKFNNSNVPPSSELYTARLQTDKLITQICEAIPEHDAVDEYKKKNGLLTTAEFLIKFKPTQAVEGGSKKTAGGDLNAKRNRELSKVNVTTIRNQMLRAFNSITNCCRNFYKRLMCVHEKKVNELEQAGNKEDELSGRRSDPHKKGKVVDAVAEEGDSENEEQALTEKIVALEKKAAHLQRQLVDTIQTVRQLKQKLDPVEPRYEKPSYVSVVMSPKFGSPRLSYHTACKEGEEEPLSPTFLSLIVAKMASPSTVEADMKARNSSLSDVHQYTTYIPKKKAVEDEKDEDDLDNDG